MRRDHMKDFGTNGRIILRKILKKLGGMVWTGPMAASCEHGN
jgi:hypothetical protein